MDGFALSLVTLMPVLCIGYVEQTTTKILKDTLYTGNADLLLVQRGSVIAQKVSPNIHNKNVVRCGVPFASLVANLFSNIVTNVLYSNVVLYCFIYFGTLFAPITYLFMKGHGTS